MEFGCIYTVLNYIHYLDWFTFLVGAGRCSLDMCAWYSVMSDSVPERGLWAVLFYLIYCFFFILFLV